MRFPFKEFIRDGAKMNLSTLWWLTGFLLTVLLASPMVSGDSDLVLHILYGRAVSASGLKAPDPILYASRNPPILQEWLFEWTMGMLDARWGLAGPLFLGAVLIGLLFSGRVQAMQRLGVGPFVATAYGLLIFIALRPHLGIRPHIVSWLGAATIMSLLENMGGDRGEWLRAVVAGACLMVLWTNLHGGFLIGPTLTGVVLLGDLIRPPCGTRKDRARRLGVALAVWSLATLVNPWGPRLHVHLLAFLGNNFLLSHTSDFQPPSFSGRTIQALIIVAAGIWPPLLLRSRQVRISSWLLAAGLSGAAFLSVRNIPFLGIVCLPEAARHLQKTVKRAPSQGTQPPPAERGGSITENQFRKGWLLGAILFGATALAVRSGLLTVALDGPLVPRYAMAWVRDHPELHDRPVFADFVLAGYILYETPVSAVYLHALNANYDEARLRTWMNVGAREKGWELELPNDITWGFLMTGTIQAAAFDASPCWRKRFEHAPGVVFERTPDDCPTP